jgi:DNA-binding PucR family transcriptional regulator
LHRSSLLKRLDKIKRLIGSDLKDADTRLYYRICLKLMKLES